MAGELDRSSPTIWIVPEYDSVATPYSLDRCLNYLNHEF
jgi:hypothetical protein